jgi:hypothetical protein
LQSRAPFSAAVLVASQRRFCFPAKPPLTRTVLQSEKEFLDMERRWLSLARSIEFVEQLDSF